MKMKPEHYEAIKTCLIKNKGTIQPNIDFRAAAHPNLDPVKCGLWGVFNAYVPCSWVCSTLYPYLNDTHIETALLAIWREIQ